MIYLIIFLPIIILLICIFTNNDTNKLNNHTNIDNKFINHIDDDCGSSQYIQYMKQFTPEQHQVEMDREVEEIWEDIVYCDLND